MEIVFTTDHNYSVYAGVTICSVCENNIEAISFHVIVDSNVTVEDECFLKSIVAKYGQKIVFYHIDSSLVSDMPVGLDGQPHHISTAAYYRLFLGQILPQSLDKVLYLDSDIIVKASLSPLWNLDISGYAVAATPDMDECNLNYYRRLKYSPACGYFNSGVLLINLEHWRKHDIQGQFIDFWRKYPERVLYHDQDIMNVVLREEKTSFPIKYNVQEAALHTEVNISWEYDEQLDEAVKFPVVIHYTTKEKPWNVSCRHPWKSEWFKYLKLAGIEGFVPVKINSGKVSYMKRVRNFMVRLGLLEPLFEYRKDL